MRVRVAIRSINALICERRFLNPWRYGLFAWQLWSHKLLRYASPFLWLIALGANIALMPRSPLYTALFVCQIAVILAGAVGFALQSRLAKLGILSQTLLLSSNEHCILYCCTSICERRAHGDMEATAVGGGAPSRDDGSGFALQEAPVAFLVIVRKGPTWSLADLEPLCRILSKKFTGEIWAFGSYDADVRVDRFRVRVVNDERSTSHIGRLVLTTRQMLRWAVELRAARVRDLAIVSLEPFNGGLLGAVRGAAHARDLHLRDQRRLRRPENFASASMPVWLRVAARRVLGAFVLSRATAVRCCSRNNCKDSCVFLTGVNEAIFRLHADRTI